MAHEPPVVCIVGPSGSGKTTLMEGLIGVLTKRGYRVAAIKHSHHGIDLDQPEKDSWRHRQAGAVLTIVASPEAVGVFITPQQEMDLETLCSRFVHDADLVLAEGYKQSGYPKILVAGREEIHREDWTSLIAAVSDRRLDLGVPVFQPEDLEGITGFLQKLMDVPEFSKRGKEDKTMAKEKDRDRERRDITSWRPFSGLVRMEREMERMFEDFFGRSWPGGWWPERFRGIRMPAIEIYEEKDDVVVKAELPGMKKEDLDINVSGNLLTIKGERKKEEETREKGYYYSERSYGGFTRTVEIPKEIQSDKIRASFKDGILEVRLPKTEEAKRKEVKIRVE